MPDVAIQDPPTEVSVSTPVTGSMLDDSLRSKLDAAMKAKGAENAKPPVVDGKPLAPAQPATTDAPEAPQTLSKPSKPALPASDSYVPGSTHKADWERIKKERDTYKAERDALKAQSGQPAPEVAKTLADLKKERDDYQAQLRSVAIERDPAFDREFAQATATATALARSATGSEHVKTLEKLLSMPSGEARDAAINELAATLPAYKQTMLGSALADLDRISFTKQAKIDEARQNWSRLQQEAHAQQTQREQESKAKLESLIAEWSDPEKGFPHLRRTDDPEHNGRVEGTLALARDIFAGNLSMDKMALASVWAASAEQLLGNITTLQTELKAANDRIAELTGNSPGAGDAGTGGTATDGSEPDVPANLSYGQAVSQQIRRAGLPLR